MELRQYQINIVNDVTTHLETNLRCCVSLATGGGKTIIFSSLLKNLEGKTLILVHREELVKQTSTALSTFNISHDKIVAGHKHKESKVYVAMVQTLYNKIKKNTFNISEYSNIIVDECHRGEFLKIIEGYKGKVIGFTATPQMIQSKSLYMCDNCNTITTNSCCGRDTTKYTQITPLSKYYHTLIEGVQVNELINQGYLVPEINYRLDNDKLADLELDKMGEYSNESQSRVFGSKEAMQNFYDTFCKLASGKKTIVFNCNTLVNKDLFDLFVLNGLPVQMYDSNDSNGWTRKEIIDWFENTPNAILFNVQVFTTGFDVKDVQVIALNKKTASLNLFVQMVGRGSRTTDKIYKPSFDVIDMGGNITEHGKWSDLRNWKQMFEYSEFKKTGTSVAPVRSCHKCESIIAANSLICKYCGARKIYTGGVFGIPKVDGKIPLPNVLKIIEYCEKLELDILEARKMVYDHFSKMFWDTPEEIYRQKRATGELQQRIVNVASAMYTAIQKSKLKGNRVRTFDSFINEIIKKIDNFYEKNRRPNTGRDLPMVQ